MLQQIKIRSFLKFSQKIKFLLFKEIGVVFNAASRVIMRFIKIHSMQV